MSAASVPAVRCAGCGERVAADVALPFRCPAAERGDDIDHVLAVDPPDPSVPVPSDGDRNPFVRFRALSHAYALARSRGMDDESFVFLVQALDARVAAVDGAGFSITPCVAQPALASAVGLKGALWVKNETGGVSGSHKARHLMGIAVYLAVVEAVGLPVDTSAPFAIASCGNAALAAAVVAKAFARPLHVFVPPDANEAVLTRLGELGATIVSCERRDADPPGDPCYLRFLEAVEGGALPFACQGNQNGLTIDGGTTLGLELATQITAGEGVDRLMLQIGGGALASATIRAMRMALRRGLITKLPSIHAVQTSSAHPLADCWRRVVDHIEVRAQARGLRPSGERSDAARAAWVRGLADGDIVVEALAHARRHRSSFMRPIEHAPASIASGILDDETYDWHEVVRGMLDSGGWPVVVGEAPLANARDLGRGHAAIPVSATGASGLAGLTQLLESAAIPPTDSAAVLFTGVQR